MNSRSLLSRGPSATTAATGRPSSVVRPAISVVVPFFGTAAEAAATARSLGRLDLTDGDQVLVVDNTGPGVFERHAPHVGVVVSAKDQQSSYYARNVGVEHSAAEWLLFLDSDCIPPPSLLDDYFSEPIPDDCGVVAGSVVPAVQEALAARYARSRGHISEDFHLARDPYPAGITANLLVRRRAWEAVGGFQERVRSGADVEFCWRVQEAGWSLAHRPGAPVEHSHPERLGGVLRKARRHAGGRAWVNRRYKGAFPRPHLIRPLARCLAGIAVWALAFRFERSLFKAMDAAWFVADEYGYLAADNRAASLEPTGISSGAAGLGQPHHSVLALNDIFPAASETFVFNEVRALRAQGLDVRIEAAARPARPNREVSRELPCDYLEDDTIASKLRDLGWLAARHPLRTMRDLAARRNWRDEEDVWPLRSLAPAARRLARSGEQHIHINFASGAALLGLRLSRLTGVPFSFTAHGYDIYRSPRNLAEKIRGAEFAAGTCEYTVKDLREIVGADGGSPIHKLIMGVDATRFRRRVPYPGGRAVVAIGRYVEKKGFRYLIEAVARLQDDAPLERLTIAGEGPLRGELADLASKLGIGDLVELPNVSSQGQVHDLLERADLLVMPSVVGSDGDRDSMPVVIKEALAMEVPVVGSREVGLPEMIAPEWGRLVPPAEPEALAAAIRELLSMPAEQRRQMGQAGRAWVTEHCDVASETARLASLIAGRELDRS
jgi:colanic acid/amylovoran biosynthesis glycosyltransferase